MALLALASACTKGTNQTASTPQPEIRETASLENSPEEALAEAATATPAPAEAPPTPTPLQIAVVQPTVTPQPTATQPIPGLIGPDNFPADVNPLTGEQVDDPAVLERLPLAIKVANMARVRPQAGLNQADLVFEHYSEGGITRFTAIFYTNTPKRVGSIRSGRLIDLEIPVMYGSAFAYSGSSHQIKEMIRASSFFERVISPDFGHGGFWRTFDAKNPSPFHVDSLFTNAEDLRRILEERGLDQRPEFANGMAFHPDPPPGGAPAEEVEVLYSGTGIFWEYRPSTGRYYRWSDGQRHEDVNTGELLNFKNIVVVKAPHLNTEIIEDTGGSPSIQIQIWGEGPAVIFRDGLRYDGVWRREVPQEMLTFYDQNGQILPLAPGNTFFELVPLEFSSLVSR
jgi:hypothetical protein